MCHICQHKTPGLGQKFFAWTTSKSDGAQHRMYGSRKTELFKELAGNVLEVGPGTGVNFDYYPKGIRWTGLEPNVAMLKYLRVKAQKRGFAASIFADNVEQIPLVDNCMDYVVCTLVLCSVYSQNAALQEINRVLKPGGKLIFIEHIGAPNGTVTRKVQEFLQPVWKALADGCDPARDTAQTLERFSFTKLSYQHFKTNAAFGFQVPHIAGEAVK